MNRAELLSAAQRAAVIAPEDSPVEVLRGTLSVSYTHLTLPTTP